MYISYSLYKGSSEVYTYGMIYWLKKFIKCISGIFKDSKTFLNLLSFSSVSILNSSTYWHRCDISDH
jgi:hypothetical protein